MKTIKEMELLRTQLAEVLYADVANQLKIAKSTVEVPPYEEVRNNFERQAAVTFDFLFKQHPLDIINIFVEDPVAKIICDQLSIVVQGTRKAAAIQELNKKSTQND